VVLDNSAWSRLVIGRVPHAARRSWQSALERDEVLVCDPFRLEALYSARDSKGYAVLAQRLAGLRQAPCDHIVWELARHAQAALAEDPRVSHRVKPADLLVAAAAHRHGVGVLHYDHDFDVIAGHTSLAFDSRWLARRGSID